MSSSSSISLTGVVRSVLREPVRAAGATVQQLVEILQPGPLEGRAGRWEHARRQQAEAAVQQAVSNYQRLQEEDRQRHQAPKHSLRFVGNAQKS